MRAYTHLAASLTLYLTLAKLRLLTWDVSPLLAMAAGSLAPDVDRYRSLLSRLIPLKHRGALHSLAGAAAASVVIALTLRAPYLPLFFALGYLSHLALDSLTPMGVAWLSPIYSHRVRGPVKVGSLTEHLAFLSLAASSALMLVL
ncbi:MAG: hypothetical protein DRJ97_02020 [Thermoprotei archaeon]|nr:MAG: hypothetical protein DRJ97_02020 [Thermoprotei archaeon]